MYTTCKKLNFNLYTAYELEGWSFIQASIRPILKFISAHVYLWFVCFVALMCIVSG